MDKYEYKVRAEEIRNLIREHEYAEAVDIADTIDWSRVKSIQTLCMISDLYKANRRYQESKEILLMAYERYPGGRLIVYSLCELSIKLEEYVQAIEYYKEYVQLAPKDTSRYILQYRLYEAQDVSLEERIEVLEEFKRKDYREKWAYELAYLYHRMGLASKCVDECDELIVTFGEGRYVIKALELKALHEPLTSAEQEKYNEYIRRRDGAIEKDNVPEPKATPISDSISDVGASTDGEDLKGAPTTEMPQEIDIQVKPVDVGQYNTMNLQEALAESMKELLDTDETESITPSTPEEDIEDNTIFGNEPMAGPRYSQNPESFSENNWSGTGEIAQSADQVQDAASAEDTSEAAGGQDNAGQQADSGVLAAEESAAPAQTGEPEETSAPGQPKVAVSQTVLYEEPGTEDSPADEMLAKTQVIPQTGFVQEPVYAGPRVEGADIPLTYPGPGIRNSRPQDLMMGETKEIPTDVVVDYVESQRLMEEMQQQSASMQAANAQAEMIPGAITGQIDGVGYITGAYDQMLAEEYSGQIRLALNEVEQVEKQITGQLSIDDVLADWEETKKENEKKREEEVRKRIIQHTGSLFNEFDEDTKASLIEQLEKAFTEAIIRESKGGEVDDSLGKKIRKEAMRAVEYMTMDGIIGPGAAEAIAGLEEDEPAKESARSRSEDVRPAVSGEEPVRKNAPDDDAADAEESADAASGQDDLTDAEEETDVEKEGSSDIADEEDSAEVSGTEAKDRGKSEPADGTDSMDVAEVRKALKEDEEEKAGAGAKTQKTQKATEPDDDAGRNSAEDEGESEGTRTLSDDEKELFGSYLTRKSTNRQICYALDNMSMAAYTGNVIVTGEEGVGTIDLAKKLIKYMQATDSNFVSRQVAKVSGKGLNEKDLGKLFDQIAGGAIIIENARGMKKSTVQRLMKVLENENLGVLAILEDTSEGMDRIVGTLPKLGELFNVRIDLKALDDKALVNYACEYAISKEHTIDEYALLALHTRIAEMQTSSHQVSVAEVRDLVDDAIYYADKKNIPHLFDIILHKRYDEEDMVILREKDFMHY